MAKDPVPLHERRELEDHLLSLLSEDPSNEAAVLERLLHYAKGQPDSTIHQNLLYVLAHLKFPPAVARHHFEEILAHKMQLAGALNRDVGFRVALLDYFLNLNKQMHNPKIVELAIYFENMKSTLTDDLTGIFNSRYLQQAVDRELNLAKRRHLHFSLILIDLDAFTTFNQHHGNFIGDRALVELALLLKNHCRAEDTVGRYGDDEFLLMAPYTTKSQAAIFAERIRHAVERTAFHGQDGARITVSGAIATYPDDATHNASELMLALKRAMAHAKHLGANQIIAYDDSLRHRHP